VPGEGLGVGEHVRRRVAVCIGPVVMVWAVALAGCSGGDGGKPDAPNPPPQGAKAPASGSPAPVRAQAVDADPAKLPKTPAQARALIRKVIADPALFGHGTVESTPYESDPARWAVLGEDCVWRQQPLPEDVLATLTRHFEVPASAGKGTVRLMAQVTAHRTAGQADWENAGMLQEMLRCPGQRLGATEELTNLISSASYLGDGQNDYADDVLRESGDYRRAGSGAAPYSWTQSRIGQFTVAVSVRAARGYRKDEAQDLDRTAGILMLHRLEREIRRSTDDEPSDGDGARGGGA
jgi:hypothetical protein